MVKLKSNQAGIAHLAAIILVVVIASISFAGWRVLNNKNNNLSQNSNQENNNETQSQANETIEENANQYSSYSHTTDGYTFHYPEDWKVEQSTEGPSTLVTSPDFIASNTIGHSGETKGGRFIISKSTIVDGSPTLEDILDNKRGIDEDAKKITVDGNEAVRYKRTYPTVSLKTSIFNAGYTYELSYFGPYSTDYEKYLADYDNLVDTFKIK